ncbi:hypothetical protein [Nocardia bovistercoris]|uniref:Uncharacterized protein n=1 Tax=Nocardia bovistercoris TaxID=2785916 RepID=A0A931IFU4_9NOCA|nr:hypothetical protein [Nocardia bovistercoris]MBH0779641.1 hypothetical protein [Nocardia bovistercoris]
MTATRPEQTAIGDRHGLPIPVHPEALHLAGAEFLTRAFHTAGTLAPDNAVTAITEFREIGGGSTGRKALLSVRYRHEQPHLHTDLFAKFSRDLDDEIRDRGRTQMETEVGFAELARTPGFPVTVPAAQFGDYHAESGTGLLITERIAFGADGIEPQHHKCLDYEMPQPYEHYRALLTAVARLVGAHRAGALPEHLIERFPTEEQITGAGQRPSPQKLPRRLTRLREFCLAFPALLPEHVRTDSFLTGFADAAVEFQRHESAIWSRLRSDTEYSGLCHWNANVDNAWFWRDDKDELHCGLMDWGCVSRMNLAMAVWGAMSGAEVELWDRHLDDLLDLFVTEIHRSGGPRLDPSRLAAELMLYIGTMGVTWLLDVPAVIMRGFAPSADLTRTDPRIKSHESIRAPLQMLTNVLNLWHAHDFGGLLESALLQRLRPG